MKRVIAILVILGFVTASSFAMEVGNVELFAMGESNENVDLFAEIQAIPIGEEEMETIEGEGLFGALIGGAIGFIVGAALGAIPGNDMASSTGAGSITGAILGGILIPTP